MSDWEDVKKKALIDKHELRSRKELHIGVHNESDFPNILTTYKEFVISPSLDSFAKFLSAYFNIESAHLAEAIEHQYYLIFRPQKLSHLLTDACLRFLSFETSPQSFKSFCERIAWHRFDFSSSVNLLETFSKSVATGLSVPAQMEFFKFASSRLDYFSPNSLTDSSLSEIYSWIAQCLEHLSEINQPPISAFKTVKVEITEHPTKKPERQVEIFLEETEITKNKSEKTFRFPDPSRQISLDDGTSKSVSAFKPTESCLIAVLAEWDFWHRWKVFQPNPVPVNFKALQAILSVANIFDDVVGIKSHEFKKKINSLKSDINQRVFKVIEKRKKPTKRDQTSNDQYFELISSDSEKIWLNVCQPEITEGLELFGLKDTDFRKP